MSDLTSMIMSDGASIGVFRVAPSGDRRGGLILLHEIFGVNAHIRDQARRFASEGYEVFAPSLFDREAPGYESDYRPEDFEEGYRLSRKAHPIELSIADVATCVDLLVAYGPVFVAGFCYGGSVAWLAAARLTGISAASAYYGRLIPECGEVPRCSTVAHFGQFDEGIPVDAVRKLVAAKPENALIYIYEAGHGFNSDRRDSFNASASSLAWSRTLKLFQQKTCGR